MHGRRRRRSPIKIDLTKKSGLGPREKETNTVKFEMDETNVDPSSDMES